MHFNKFSINHSNFSLRLMSVVVNVGQLKSPSHITNVLLSATIKDMDLCITKGVGGGGGHRIPRMVMGQLYIVA